MALEKIVEVKCLKHTYPDETELEFCGLDFSVEAGEKVGLIGPNGSGKTTLLNHILGFLTPEEGSVRVFGWDVTDSTPAKRIGFVLQNVEDQLIGPTLYDEIAFSARNFGLPEEQVKKRVDKLMKNLNLQQAKNKLVHYLSGGQKKKAALAGALAHEPDLLVLDEPLSELDEESTEAAIELLDSYLTTNSATLVMATNSPNLPLFDTKLSLGGKVVQKLKN